jgi:hypothetical protein
VPMSAIVRSARYVEATRSERRGRSPTCRNPGPVFRR